MKRIAILILSLIAVMGCAEKVEEISLPAIAQSAIYDETSIYFQDYGHYNEDISGLPIGVMDWSLEGYSVVETFLTADCYDNVTGDREPDNIVDFGGENFQVLLDMANGPYYPYIVDGHDDFLQEQVLRNVIFLTGRSYYNLAMDETPMGIKPRVKLVIVASPVADFKVMDDINNFLEATGTGVKALGVMSCGIESMVADIASKKEVSVAVLFPDGGLKARNYEEALRKAAVDNGFAGKLNVFGQETEGLSQAIKGNMDYIDTAATRLRLNYQGPQIGISYNNIDLALIERYNFNYNGNNLLTKKRPDGSLDIQINSVENYIRYYMVSVIERHRRSGSTTPISKFYLADFRYHSIKDIVDKVISELYNYRRDGMYLYRNSIDANYKIVDPMECAVRKSYAMLRENDLLAVRGAKSELYSFITMPSTSLPEGYVTAEGNLVDSVKYSRAPEAEFLTTKQLPFDSRYLEDKEIARIADNSPNAFLLISNSLF